MEISLAPLTWDNIDDVLANNDSSSEFYSLPRDWDEAERHLSMVRNQLRHERGYSFNAYDAIESRTLVGGGQIFSHQSGDVVNVAWWVVAAQRRKGYGKAIAQALESAAKDSFTDLRRFELLIHQRNIGSRALAASMAYECSELIDQDDHVAYQKIL